MLSPPLEEDEAGGDFCCEKVGMLASSIVDVMVFVFVVVGGRFRKEGAIGSESEEKSEQSRRVTYDLSRYRMPMPSITSETLFGRDTSRSRYWRQRCHVSHLASPFHA